MASTNIMANGIAKIDTNSIEHTLIENTEKLLFYIQRTSSKNTVVYDLNLDKSGNIAESEPIDIYWKRFCCGGERKDLNYIQRKFAYGVKLKPIANNAYTLNFLATDKLTITIKKSLLIDEIAAVAQVNNSHLEVRRILIVMEEGESMWFPKIEKVLIEGVDYQTGFEITETIFP